MLFQELAVLVLMVAILWPITAGSDDLPNCSPPALKCSMFKRSVCEWSASGEPVWACKGYFEAANTTKPTSDGGKNLADEEKVDSTSEVDVEEEEPDIILHTGTYTYPVPSKSRLDEEGTKSSLPAATLPLPIAPRKLLHGEIQNSKQIETVPMGRQAEEESDDVLKIKTYTYPVSSTKVTPEEESDIIIRTFTYPVPSRSREGAEFIQPVSTQPTIAPQKDTHEASEINALTETFTLPLGRQIVPELGSGPILPTEAAITSPQNLTEKLANFTTAFNEKYISLGHLDHAKVQNVGTNVSEVSSNQNTVTSRNNLVDPGLEITHRLDNLDISRQQSKILHTIPNTLPVVAQKSLIGLQADVPENQESSSSRVVNAKSQIDHAFVVGDAGAAPDSIQQTGTQTRAVIPQGFSSMGVLTNLDVQTGINSIEVPGQQMKIDSTPQVTNNPVLADVKAIYSDSSPNVQHRTIEYDRLSEKTSQLSQSRSSSDAEVRVRTGSDTQKSLDSDSTSILGTYGPPSFVPGSEKDTSQPSMVGKIVYPVNSGNSSSREIYNSEGSERTQDVLYRIFNYFAPSYEKISSLKSESSGKSGKGNPGKSNGDYISYNSDIDIYPHEVASKSGGDLLRRNGSSFDVHGVPFEVLPYSEASEQTLAGAELSKLGASPVGKAGLHTGGTENDAESIRISSGSKSIHDSAIQLAGGIHELPVVSSTKNDEARSFVPGMGVANDGSVRIEQISGRSEPSSLEGKGAGIFKDFRSLSWTNGGSLRIVPMSGESKHSSLEGKGAGFASDDSRNLSQTNMGSLRIEPISGESKPSSLEGNGAGFVSGSRSLSSSQEMVANAERVRPLSDIVGSWMSKEKHTGAKGGHAGSLRYLQPQRYGLISAELQSPTVSASRTVSAPDRSSGVVAPYGYGYPLYNYGGFSSSGQGGKVAGPSGGLHPWLQRPLLGLRLNSYRNPFLLGQDASPLLMYPEQHKRLYDSSIPLALPLHRQRSLNSMPISYRMKGHNPVSDLATSNLLARTISALYPSSTQNDGVGKSKFDKICALCKELISLVTHHQSSSASATDIRNKKQPW